MIPKGNLFFSSKLATANDIVSIVVIAFADVFMYRTVKFRSFNGSVANIDLFIVHALFSFSEMIRKRKSN